MSIDAQYACLDEIFCNKFLIVKFLFIHVHVQIRLFTEILLICVNNKTVKRTLQCRFHFDSTTCTNAQITPVHNMQCKMKHDHEGYHLPVHHGDSYTTVTFTILDLSLLSLGLLPRRSALLIAPHLFRSVQNNLITMQYLIINDSQTTFEPAHEILVLIGPKLSSCGIRLDGSPGRSESSLGAQSFCWFCHVAAHLFV